ncbi:MAG: SpoIIE family protein phosphatase [Pseudonocardiales bacterium]
MTSVGEVTGSVRPIFDGGSEMGRLMVAMDWETTPLRAPQTWPEMLRRTVRMMLASKQQMVLFWGAQYVALYNDAYFPVIGSKHPGALGRPVREHWAELLHVLHPLLDGVVQSGKAFWAHDHPFPLWRHGFLERTYFDISYDPVPLEDGRVGGVLCLVTDTTGRVLSQRRMRTLGELGVATAGGQQAEKVARQVVTVLADNPDDVPFAQVYLREGGVLRRSASTVADQEPGTEMIAPGNDTPGPAVVAQVLDTGRPASAPATWFTRRGTQRDIDLALILPITSGTGIEGVLVAGVNPLFRLPGAYREFYDVVAATVSGAVANALAHEQERRRVQALAELDRAKTEFFANVSHEFRTPLTLVVGPTEDALADRVDALPTAQRDRLEIVRRNAGRLRRLVDDLLDVARIEGGRLQAETVAVDLAELTRGIAESFAPAVERAGLIMQIDCPPLNRTVLVDPGMWEKILLNLLSNALKYTHEGQLTVALRPRGEQVELTVSDTGVGIPADQLPLLFQRFHRVRGAVGRTHEGAGIGLAMVRELVSLLDGEVGVDSRVGQGSTFTVRLCSSRSTCNVPATSEPVSKRPPMAPLYLDEALHWNMQPMLPAVSLDEAAQPSVEAPAGACVLVAEDNADMRAYLTTLLAKHYTVIGTADGQTALQAITAHRPDLVLADVMMPALDGFGLLAALRGDSQTAAIPVVLLSARAGTEATAEGLAAGADDYLVKPFSASDLLARVRSNLELARLRNHESAWRIALVNALQDGFAVTTADGAVIEMNEAFATMFGYGPEGLPYQVPHPWWPDPELDPDGFQQANSAFTVIAVRGEGRFVLPMRHREGHRIWVAAAVASVRDRDGRQQLFVTTVRDVTAEHLAFDDQRAVAVTLQSAVLGPTDLPPGFAVRYEPAAAHLEVGGDWYDVVSLAEDCVGVVVGDCVGRGLGAAAVMGQLRSACRALLLQPHRSPGQVLAALDDFAALIPDAQCTTLFCAIVDRSTGSVRYSSAGHPPGLLVHADGSSETLDAANSVPLVTMVPARRPEATATLRPGSTLLLYTDGLIERRLVPLADGISRLRASLLAARQLAADALATRLAETLLGAEHEDDVAYLIYQHSCRRKR